jgi:hypothetical protein
MMLSEFFDCDEDAPVAQAFTTVREFLNRQVVNLPNSQSYSEWTLRLGKGGPKPDGGFYEGQEQSLYRHCLEVAVFGLWLFYHAWQAGRLPLSREADPVPALRTLFAIAFAHDADKRAGGKSRSPSREDVQAVYRELDMGNWSGLTPEELHAAVSYVENRGLGQVMFGDALLDPLTARLAEFVGQGDNLLSRAARQGGTPEAFIGIYNEDLARLHAHYAVSDRPLRRLRFRHHPIVLQRLQMFLTPWFTASELYPLVFVRRGEWLEMGVTEDMDFGAWLDRFEAHLSENKPSLKVAATTGTATLFHVACADDVIAAVRNSERQAHLLLRVAARDWERVAPLVAFWVMQCGAPFSTTPMKGSLCPILKANGEIPSSHPFWRAAALAAVQTDRAATARLLAVASGAVEASFRHNGIDPEPLDELSLRTAAALQASLLIGDDDLPGVLDELKGAWPERIASDLGARAIVDSLKAQAGLSGSDDTALLPYTPPQRGGTCLLCGAPTEQIIETSRMKLAGLKASSFYNGIGHEKHLWSEKGENYLCPACVRVQGLLLETQPTLRSNPMLIATPVRHLLDTRTKELQQNVLPNFLRGYDAVSRENRNKVLPWQTDARFDEPLLFEERPTALGEVVDHMHRLACYAALSGEPVHAFLASQRECKAAFLYEGTPELLKELLHDLMDGEGGVSRGRKPGQDITILERLIHRLEMFSFLLDEREGKKCGGMTGLQAMPRFGWWAAAFVLSRIAIRRGKWETQLTHFVELARKEYPMNEYDAWLGTLIKHAVEIHRPDRKASGAEWTLMLRTAFETYQKHYAFGPEATRDAIAQRLRGDLSRRYSRHLDEEHLRTFAEAAYALLAKAEEEFELESGFTRFLLAAYEGGLRRAVTEFWKNRETSPEAEESETTVEPAA